MREQLLQLLHDRYDSCVFKTLGIELVTLDPVETVLKLTIDERHLQQMGVVHGGIYVLLMESAVSLAAACTLTRETDSIVGVEINANHVKSVRSGELIARTRPIHQGSRTFVYEGRVENELGQLLSISRSTLMVVPRGVAG